MGRKTSLSKKICGLSDVQKCFYVTNILIFLYCLVFVEVTYSRKFSGVFGYQKTFHVKWHTVSKYSKRCVLKCVNT